MKKAALLEQKLQLETRIVEARKAQYDSLAIPSLRIVEHTGLPIEKLVEAFNAKIGTEFTIDAESGKIFDMGSDNYASFSRFKTFLEGRGATTKLVEYNEDGGLHTLIESELEKAQVVLAAQAVLDKLQKAAEDIIKIQTEQLMPISDHIKAQFGRDVADKFNTAAKEQLDAAFEAVRGAKDVIGNEVEKLNAVMNGEEYPTDIASGEEDEFAPTNDLGMDLEDGDDADGEVGDDDLGGDLDFDDLDLGRTKKD